MASRRRTLNERLTIWVPDCHFGEHDEEATDLAAKIIEIYRPHHIAQAGDLLECGPFSSWASHKVQLAREYDFLEKEIKPAKAWLARVIKNCAHYTQLEGNHEYRVERQAIANEFGSAVWSMIRPDKVLLSEYGKKTTWVPYVNDQDITAHVKLAPNLLAVHGWTACQHAAWVHLQKAARAGCSILFGHTHRSEEKTTRHPFTDDLLIAASPGCLRTLRPGFTQAHGPTDWSHGLGFLFKSRRNPRDWTYYNVAIRKGRAILPDGREIKV